MTKQIFTQSQQPEEEEILPKQEFYNVETTIRRGVIGRAI